jgi:hypothetical protein
MPTLHRHPQTRPPAGLAHRGSKLCNNGEFLRLFNNKDLNDIAQLPEKGLRNTL